MARKQSRTEAPELSRDAVLRFIADNPGRSSKRDIAKAFDIKGDRRVALKDLIADLQAEGVLAGTRKCFKRPGQLPPVTVLEVRSRDRDGGLLAEPAEWNEDEDGERPRLLVRQNPKTQTAGLGERILAKIDDAEDGTKIAAVIRVLQKSRGLMLGVFRAEKHGGGRVEPVERKQNEILIRPGDENGAKDGDLVEADMAKQRRIGLPVGKVIEVVGSAQSERAISAIALHAHGIPHIFPDGVHKEAEDARPAIMAGREDWRSVPLVTIDPPDAKDHDDAVHALVDDDPKNPGGMVVTVAIADVAAYVRTASKLDDEAKLRGNSVYFPDRVVPMLPERISNDLCSLKEGVDRPAMAVRMVIGGDGRKRSHSFHRIMMKSRAKLAYEEAQAAIDGTPNEVPAEVTEGMLRPLWAAYRLVSQARDERAPLALDLPERKIKLDESGRVSKVVVPERLDAHRLIEEFMILANVAAAETLENKRQALIYRVHDAPSLAKLESLREFLKTLEISLAKSGSLRPSHFNGILTKVKGTENESLVNEVVLRSQSQAVYEPDNIGHFGLNLARYAHFTSPIRRYADLIVHRALITALNLGDDGLTKEAEADLVETAEAISQAERRAMAAERDTVDRLIAHFLADQVGEDFTGRIAGVTKAGLFVALPTYGADGFVPISTLGKEFFRFDEAARMVVGERSSRGYRLGDTVEVRIVEVAPLTGSMQFEMLTEPRKLPRGTQSFHKSHKSTRNHRRSTKNTAAKVRKRR
ncbi:putative exoribonuclease ii protein [Fulvimarina pelagi HTCC2506]|uniref:Ribonuclease R n=2 Tax=Fulvimarina pelagi TaxID=217511 RepID=Q0FZT5_9HYPH|nr:ribonuclease R [Fulvimarina pelagi]EAU40506.1 putative exoribonuclease ii protein [Fulvimarina pelagi HTCC2506]BAT31531.1 VacB and RNase II family 3'-5' exoribonucleases [Fulvimarina pelagi]